MRVAVLLSLLALSCAGSAESKAPSTNTDTGAAADDTSPADDTMVADAGMEICGTKVGDTFCDYSFSGYISNDTTGLATSKAYGTYKLSEALALGTQKYVYIFHSAYW